jgi:methyl-galactoside transport system substrate-binding protein
MKTKGAAAPAAPLAALLAAAALASLAAFAGCAREAAPPKVKIGVALYQTDDTFIGLVRDSIAAAANAYVGQDGAGGYKVNVSFADAAGNQTVQNRQVDDFIAQGYAAVCVNMVDRTAAAVTIDKAKSADVPVVFFNREPVQEDMMRWEKAFYVGAKAEQSGEMQGRLAAEAILADPARYDRDGDGAIQYVMLEGEQSHQDTLLRTEHCLRALREAGVAVERLATGSAKWQRSQGKERMGNWLATFGGRIEAVFSNNDDMALGAIDALQEAGMNLGDPAKSVMVLGVDATPEAVASVRDGAMFATVLQDHERMGAAIFDIACSMAVSGEARTPVPGFDGKYLFLDYVPITRDVAARMAEGVQPSSAPAAEGAELRSGDSKRGRLR